MTIDRPHEERRPLTSVANSLTGAAAVTDNWRAKAICLDEDPELFFPIGTTGPALDQIKQAKEVCARCPVRQECLEWALDNHQSAGIWGGLDEEERRILRRSRQRARRSSARRAGGERP